MIFWIIFMVQFINIITVHGLIKNAAEVQVFHHIN